jgi:hypothetical protein
MKKQGNYFAKCENKRILLFRLSESKNEQMKLINHVKTFYLL